MIVSAQVAMNAVGGGVSLEFYASAALKSPTGKLDAAMRLSFLLIIVGGARWAVVRDAGQVVRAGSGH